MISISSGQADAELITGALEGNKFAKEQLFRRYVHRVAGRVYRLLGNDADLEDIVQDAFVAAYSALGTLRQLDSFAGWLDAIATRTAISVLKRRRLLRRLGLLHPEPIELETIISRTTPQDLAAEFRAVYRVIDELPTSERVVLTLRRVEQLELAEIAVQTGLSLSTVKRRLAKAEKHLEDRLGTGREVS